MDKKNEKKNFEIGDLTSDRERNRIAKELEPLMVKIVNQWDGKCPLDRELLEMQARYGVTYALNNYREGTSQSFIQYAAWCIRNWILNGISEFGSTVRIGAGERKRLLDNGDTVYRIYRIGDSRMEDTSTLSIDNIAPEMVEADMDAGTDFEMVSRDDALKKLSEYVSKNFDDRHKDIFFSTYELGGKKKMKGTELAKKYHCTAALISQLNRDVLEGIRHNGDLMELLDAVR
jgi:DNA-directed RNA polymerase specialized sigma subunit